MSLLDGKYRVEGSWYNMLEVDGDKAMLHEPTGNTYDMTFKYGEFGEAHADIAEKMSQETNNLEFSFSSGGQDYTEEGVVGEDGKVVMMKGAMGVCNMSWMTEEEAAAYEAEGDPIEAPSCPYDLQPGNIGKLVWLDGPPCSGKSVSAQLLGNTRGYVYYEGDCFGAGKNPYIPLDAEDPSMAMLSQRTLKGEGMEDRARLGMKVWEVSGKREENEEEWLETMSEFYSLMCEDIMRERARVGGDWVVTTCLTGKDVRSVIREKLGPELVFVVLNLELEVMEKRVNERHQGDQGALDMMKSFYALCEPAEDDEENTTNVTVTEDMTKEEVLDKIKEVIE